MESTIRNHRKALSLVVALWALGGVGSWTTRRPAMLPKTGVLRSRTRFVGVESQESIPGKSSMTTLFTRKVRCALCRHRSPQRWVASTYVAGPPDLDLRPAGNARSMLRFSVQVCPSCGYSALDITQADKHARAVVRTEAFQALRAGPLGDTLAGRLLRAALIVRHQGNPGLAGELTLGAAWAADDDGDTEQARTCRNEAVELISAALDISDAGTEEAEHTATRLTDILRRAGRFDEAVGLADRLLAGDLDPTLKAVLAFERHRAVASDAAGYTMEHALQGSGGSTKEAERPA